MVPISNNDTVLAFLETGNGGLNPILEQVRCVAPTPSPVLIFGETGVGKELIARAVHMLSDRANKPFVRVNCGSIAESLIENELFGSEKGSFTGSIRNQVGRFERAHTGTVFLDEIGELPLSMQTKLLHAVQFKEIERIGGTTPISLDIRFVCATNRDLKAMVRSGHFRQDLFYRFNVFSINIPPLRERRQDIPALLDYFIKKKSQEIGLNYLPIVDAETLAPLMQTDWPGNVRQMEHLVERSLILHRMKSPNQPLRCLEGLPPTAYIVYTSQDAGGAGAPTSPNFGVNNDSAYTPYDQQTNKALKHSASPIFTSKALDDVVKEHICQVLAQCSGRISGPHGAAKILKIHPNTLRYRMTKLGIAKDKT